MSINSETSPAQTNTLATEVEGLRRLVENKESSLTNSSLATDKSERKNRTIRSRTSTKKETKRKAKTKCQSAKSARRERDKIG
jgi:hypothetical protein